jgi:hypothetical protein
MQQQGVVVSVHIGVESVVLNVAGNVQHFLPQLIGAQAVTALDNASAIAILRR